MRKIINNPEHFVDETMEGIIAAYGDRLKLYNGDKRILISNYPTREGKVGIVTAGGSGHLPVFLGYVGSGLLDGCTVGNVFASPSAQKMADTIRACDKGNGVLCLFGNYGGDKMNMEMACEEVELEDDIATRTVLVCDDVASAPKEKADKRRGVAGMIYAFKTQKALNHIRTMGVALSPCVVPEVGVPTFSIDDTITSLCLMGMSRVLKGHEDADTLLLSEALLAGIAKVMEKAGSKPGEKTILDSVVPASEALRDNAGTGSKTAFAAAAAAAKTGSEATADMPAVHGRAAYYGEKSIGLVDGGAEVGRLIFETLAACAVDEVSEQD